ncbi:MAG TPA: alpha-hydroxy acid oxidase [Gemmataceae bacterium]|jgi:4-hydroxymandelate oxidase|nr:alpha-hydroxy acid oxidase [Gemmataceae bacterium]
MDLSKTVNLHDFEVLARQRLPADVIGFIASGAADEITLRENRRAYEDIFLRYRVLRGVDKRDLTTSLFGQKVSFPVLIAPTGFHKLIHADGEIGMARAAAAAGTILVVSTMANTPLEEVRAAVAGPMWFQLYVYKDRGVTRSLLERAEAAGYDAIQVTVDLPVLGRREAQIRDRFGLPAHLRLVNLESAGFGELSSVLGDSGIAAYTMRMLDDSLTWKDIEWFKSICKLPMLVKGIVRADDARLAVEAGAAGVVVSNHGGRQLDTSIPTIRALSEVAEAVGDRAVVMVDGGIQRGTDVVKALALGAMAVQIGRPTLWGLAVGGQAGVASVLQLLKLEFDLAMALCGCASVAEVNRDLIAY